MCAVLSYFNLTRVLGVLSLPNSASSESEEKAVEEKEHLLRGT